MTAFLFGLDGITSAFSISFALRPIRSDHLTTHTHTHTEHIKLSRIPQTMDDICLPYSKPFHLLARSQMFHNFIDFEYLCCVFYYFLIGPFKEHIKHFCSVDGIDDLCWSLFVCHSFNANVLLLYNFFYQWNRSTASDKFPILFCHLLLCCMHIAHRGVDFHGIVFFSSDDNYAHRV